MSKSFRKLPIVTFDKDHCDPTCPQLKGFTTRCRLDDQLLGGEQFIDTDDTLKIMFYRTEECKRSEI